MSGKRKRIKTPVKTTPEKESDTTGIDIESDNTSVDDDADATNKEADKKPVPEKTIEKHD